MIGQEVDRLTTGYVREPMLVRLKREQNELQERLTQVEAAINALEENPDIAEIFEKLQKVAGFM